MIQTQAIPIPKPVLQIPGMFLRQLNTVPSCLYVVLFDEFQSFLGQVWTKNLKYCTQSSFIDYEFTIFESIVNYHKIG